MNILLDTVDSHVWMKGLNHLRGLVAGILTPHNQTAHLGAWETNLTALIVFGICTSKSIIIGKWGYLFFWSRIRLYSSRVKIIMYSKLAVTDSVPILCRIEQFLSEYRISSAL